MSAPESYASIDDFNASGLPVGALSSLQLPQIQNALMRASRLADSFLRDRYTLPLRCPHDPALVQWVCHIAAWYLISTRGFNPNAAGFDQVIRMNYDDAISNLKRVANGQQSIDVPANTNTDQPMVDTSPSRGFESRDPTVGNNSWGQ